MGNPDFWGAPIEMVCIYGSLFHGKSQNNPTDKPPIPLGDPWQSTVNRCFATLFEIKPYS
jgi:hypothetical protein